MKSLENEATTFKKIYKMFLKGFSGYCKVNFHQAAIFQEGKAVRFNYELEI